VKLIPVLELGWLNGWILIFLLYLVYGILLIVFPKAVVTRLHDRSGRGKRHKVVIYIGSSLAFVYFGLIVFTPLAFSTAVFIPGIIMYVLGLVGFVVALLNFRSTPLDKPVARGLYRISRHPQQVAFFVAFIGICMAIGSWIALFIQIISSIFLHARVVAEEKACLERYGDSYQIYMKLVHRYFLFI
jgi:protein-S-isoprenylcysteine O-methyltransferase Ste14